MKHSYFDRIISTLLVIAMLCGLLVIPSGAAALSNSGTLANSSTVTIQMDGSGGYLSKSTGGNIVGGYWKYTSNDGLTGSAYCVNWGLTGVSPSKSLPIQPYDRNPQTMGVFAGGYPNRTLEQFKELHTEDVQGVASLTETEYKYATQVAIWASCGQIAVPGTSFTAGRTTLVEPTADAQGIRIYDSVKALLFAAQFWDKHLYTGLSIRAEENTDIRAVEIINRLGLEGAAEDGMDGIQKETINGKEYYTRVLYLASATSTWIDGRTTKVYSTDAPSGIIFVAEDNSPLEMVQENGATCYKVDTSGTRNTNLNANGSEYYGTFKVCIPVDNASDEGSFTIKARGGVAQYNLFLASNPSTSEQSYIISDPGYITLDASADFKWSNTDDPGETANLQIIKTGPGGAPLEGAEFTLSGNQGTTVTSTSDRNGQVVWVDLPADETFTLTETKAPDNCQPIAPMNVTLTAGRTSYMTVSNGAEKGFTVKKVDAQNKGSLQGAVFRFEQIDGSYTTMLQHKREIQKSSIRLQRVWNRQNGLCLYCGQRMLSDQDLDIVEIINGHGSRTDNLAYIHAHCANNTYSKVERPPIDLAHLLRDFLEDTSLSESPYQALAKFFSKSKQSTIRLSFRQIENILQDRLPWEAHFYDSFWYDDDPDTILPLWKEEGFLFSKFLFSEPDYRIARSWISQGYRIKSLYRESSYVVFMKEEKHMSNIILPKELTEQLLPDEIVYEFFQLTKDFVKRKGLSWNVKEENL